MCRNIDAPGGALSLGQRSTNRDPASARFDRPSDRWAMCPVVPGVPMVAEAGIEWVS